MRLVFLGALLAGCAGTAPAPALPPVTDADPLPHPPPPAERVMVGRGPTGLAMSGGFDEARALGLRFLEAVIAGQRDEMDRLLAERVALTQPRLTAATRSRTEVLQSVLAPARRRGVQSTATLESLVAVDLVRATTLGAESEPNQRLPHGLDADDVVLTIPLTNDGQRALRMMLPGWRSTGKIIVRGGASPRIVGL